MTFTGIRFGVTALMAAALLAGPAFAQDAEEGGSAKKKTPHCNGEVARICDQLKDLSDIGNDVWKVGTYAATLCSKSAEIEQSRKRRRDKIEYEARLKEIAEDEDREYKEWKPPETQQVFNERTTATCRSSQEYYCSEMRLAAAEIADPDAQVEALEMVETACYGEAQAASSE